MTSNSESEHQKASAMADLLLERYPEQGGQSTLIAWDSADEYLLNAFSSVPQKSGVTLIFNDDFGALSCALRHCNPINISDSYISQFAAKLNLVRNGFAEDDVAFIDCLTDLPLAPAVALIKIPKSLALLEFQLSQLSRVTTSETVIIAGAKTQRIHNSTIRLFEKWLGPTTTSLAKKKSRLIFSRPTGELRAPMEPILTWPLASTNYRIANYPSVFSRSALDIGARFFMQHLPKQIAGKIVDLGCGNGVIGLMALMANPQASLLFTDESYMATASSRYNVTYNCPNELARCRFSVDNSLTQQPDNEFQLVLCNPPFHQSNTITDHIAKQMFRDAKRCLKIGGELRIIGNRHLGYFNRLKTLFGYCETVAANQKFVILKSIKMA